MEEFIHETCELLPEHPCRRSEFYDDYKQWCSDNGRKPFSKGRVKELLEHNIGMGIRLVEINGYETFRGIKKKSPESSSKGKPKGKTPSVPASALSTDDIAEVPDTPGDVF